MYIKFSENFVFFYTFFHSYVHQQLKLAKFWPEMQILKTSFLPFINFRCYKRINYSLTYYHNY